VLGNLKYHLQLYCVYHSFWYRTVLLLLCVSIFVCTVERSKTTLRRLRRPVVRASLPSVTRMPAAVQGSLKGAPEDAVDAATRFLGSRRYAVCRADHDQGTDLYARRGALRLLGPMLVHISVLLVFLGAVYGRSTWFGSFAANAWIEQGGWYRDSRTDQYFQLRGFDVPFRPGHDGETTVPVDYASNVAVYEPVVSGPAEQKVYVFTDTSVPPGGASVDGAADVVVPADDPRARSVSGGREVGLRQVREARIRVNHPLMSKGIGLYQQDWGAIVDLVFESKSPEGSTQTAQATWILHGGTQPRDGDALARLGVGANAHGLVRLKRDAHGRHIAQGGDNQVSPTGNRLPLGPSLYIEGATSPQDAMTGTWQDLGYLSPSHPLRFGDATIRVSKVTPFTGLEVKRDPGVGVVMFGFAVALVGLVLAFYVPVRQARVKVVRLKDGGLRVAAGATAGADEASARRLIEDLAEALELAPRGRSGKR